MAVTTPKRKPPKRKTGDAANPWPGRLRAVRALLGITQAQAAARLKVTTRAWIYWELGDKLPSPPIALLLNHFCEHPENFAE